MSRPTDLSGETLGLLAAIVTALDLPMPTITTDDEREHYRVLERRAADVRISLAVLLSHPARGVLHDTIRDLSRYVAKNPVTYTPFRFEERGTEG
ncbi:hypothetical protein [Streptomyces zaomyceticus]|uniref:hypothetical protein n=1 Tax=Streptomyces zaomyceticus TaxID=68286 RepID=UPI0033B8F723